MMAKDLPISVEYVADASDVEALITANREDARELLARTRDMPTAWEFWRNLMAVAWGVTFIAIVVRRLAGKDLLPDGWEVLAIVVSCWCTLTAREMYRSRRRIAGDFSDPKQVAHDPSMRTAFGHHVVRFDNEGIRVTTVYYDAVFRWHVLRRIETTDSAMLVFSLSGLLIRVPARAFGDPAEFRHACDAVIAFLKSRGCDESSRLLAFARASIPHCPACGYDRRNLDSLRCPECGNEINLEHYPLGAYFDESTSAEEPSGTNRKS